MWDTANFGQGEDHKMAMPLYALCRQNGNASVGLNLPKMAAEMSKAIAKNGNAGVNGLRITIHSGILRADILLLGS